VANLLHQLQVQWLAARRIQREYHFTEPVSLLGYSWQDNRPA
jgi:hypothetical protein